MSGVSGRCVLCERQMEGCFRLMVGRFNDQDICRACLKKLAAEGKPVEKAGFIFTFEETAYEDPKTHNVTRTQSIVVSRHSWRGNQTRIPLNLLFLFIDNSSLKHAKEEAVGLNDLFDELEKLTK